MASGCAVVASRTGAFEYIVLPGQTGELIPTDDVDALAVAVKKLTGSNLHSEQHVRQVKKIRNCN
ncbi:glycosyltransferase, partial [bacterium]|nr:glycosyltransferase [bacterium]